MPLELRPLTKDDAPEATRILVASYENDRFRTMVFPNGLNQNTINIITRSRVKSVDESDHYPLKIVDTDNGDRIAACAVWAYTKAMSDDDWDRARDEALSAYPEARKDILDEYMALEQDMKRRIMGHTRWWGKSYRVKENHLLLGFCCMHS